MNALNLDVILTYFASLTAFVGGIVLITDWLNNLLKIKKSWAKQLISWLVALIAASIGVLGCYGIFGAYCAMPEVWERWVCGLLTGIAAGLVANGIYDIPYVQKILDAIITIIVWLTSLFSKKKE